MTDKLTVYNEALGHLLTGRLANLTENRSERRELDAVWTAAVEAVLEAGIWAFALRTSQLSPDTDLEERFGLDYGYTLPDDCKRLRRICVDEALTEEDRSYQREGVTQIWSSSDTLYVTMVSDLDAYGFNLGAWSAVFASAVAAELAYRASGPILRDKASKLNLEAVALRKLNKAKRLDALDEKVRGKPTSSWVRSRFGSNSSNDQRRSSSS